MVQTKIISFYSFRDGTGKSTILANLAVAIARKKTGKRVGIIDTNLASPGLDYFFFKQETGSYLNDYLAGRCVIDKAVYTIEVQQGVEISLIPASPKMGDIAYSSDKTLDYQYLCDGLDKLTNNFKLDYLLIDCPSGIKVENLLSMSISNGVAFVLRPNKQDFQEALMALEVCEKIDIKNKFLVMNKVLTNKINELDAFKTKVHKTFHQQASLVGILPYSELLMEFSLQDDLKQMFSLQQKDKENDHSLFYLEYPGDIWNKEIDEIVRRIIN